MASAVSVRKQIRDLRAACEQIGLYLDDLNNEIDQEKGHWGPEDYGPISEFLHEAIGHALEAEDAARDAAGKDPPEDEEGGGNDDGEA